MAEPPPPPPPPPTEEPTNGSGAAAEAPLKRQRRPSVRLGDPGEQPAAAVPSFDSSRRPKHPPHLHHIYKPSKEPPRPSSRTRPLTHLHAPDADPPSASDDRAALLPVDENLEPLSAALRRAPRDPKPKKPGPSIATAIKRVRSSWAPPKLDEPPDAAADHKSSGGEEGFRGGSESPSDRGFAGDGDVPSETDGDGRDWNNANDNGRCWWAEVGGVPTWLSRLGLERYAPVFEIHEVDDEVLPMLTLEDLKDMGINAVGSRRKMYCAIQKLRKNLG